MNASATPASKRNVLGADWSHDFSDADWVAFEAEFHAALVREKNEWRPGDDDPMKYLLSLDDPNSRTWYCAVVEHWIRNDRPPLDIRRLSLAHLNFDKKAQDLADWLKRFGFSLETWIQSYRMHIAMFGLRVEPRIPPSVKLKQLGSDIRMTVPESEGDWYASCDSDRLLALDLIGRGAIVPYIIGIDDPMEAGCQRDAGKWLRVQIEPLRDLTPRGVAAPWTMQVFLNAYLLRGHPQAVIQLIARWKEIFKGARMPSTLFRAARFRVMEQRAGMAWHGIEDGMLEFFDSEERLQVVHALETRDNQGRVQIRKAEPCAKRPGCWKVWIFRTSSMPYNPKTELPDDPATDMEFQLDEQDLAPGTAAKNAWDAWRRSARAEKIDRWHRRVAIGQRNRSLKLAKGTRPFFQQQGDWESEIMKHPAPIEEFHWEEFAIAARPDLIQFAGPLPDGFFCAGIEYVQETFSNILIQLCHALRKALKPELVRTRLSNPGQTCDPRGHVLTALACDLHSFVANLPIPEDCAAIVRDSLEQERQEASAWLRSDLAGRDGRRQFEDNTRPPVVESGAESKPLHIEFKVVGEKRKRAGRPRRITQKIIDAVRVEVSRGHSDRVIARTICNRNLMEADGKTNYQPTGDSIKTIRGKYLKP